MIKNDLYIEEIDSFEGFLRLEKIWNKLLFVSQMNEPYLTYEWQLSWFKNFGQGSKLFILLVKAGGEVYGIAPLIISKAFGFRTIKFIGSGWSDYLNFILKRQEQEICDAIFEYIAQVKRKWDFIFLSDVLHYPNKENMFSSSVKKNRLKMEARKYYACLYIPITGDFNSFLKSKSKGFREYIRNDGKAKRKLQKEGDVEMVAIHHPSHHPGIIKILCDIENRSWKKEEKTNHFRSQAILSFFDDIINVFMKNKWIKIWLMMIDQNPIAYLISFYYNKKIYMYLQAYDKSYKNSGAILFNNIVKLSYEQGITEVQLLRGESEQKSRWTSDVRQNYQIIIYKNTIKSLIIYFIYKFRWKASQNRVWRKIYFKTIKIKRKILNSS